MSSEEEEVVVGSPPPPPKKILGVFPATADARQWRRKWSTKLAGLAVMLDAAVLAFMAGPEEWRAGFPIWAGVGLLVLSMAVKALIPLATSIQQAPK
jgi:hypothetical protein